jgi:hypothetical protein
VPHFLYFLPCAFSGLLIDCRAIEDRKNKRTFRHKPARQRTTDRVHLSPNLIPLSPELFQSKQTMTSNRLIASDQPIFSDRRRTRLARLPDAPRAPCFSRHDVAQFCDCPICLRNCGVTVLDADAADLASAFRKFGPEARLTAIKGRGCVKPQSASRVDAMLSISKAKNKSSERTCVKIALHHGLFSLVLSFHTASAESHKFFPRKKQPFQAESSARAARNYFLPLHIHFHNNPLRPIRRRLPHISKYITAPEMER